MSQLWDGMVSLDAALWGGLVGFLVGVGGASIVAWIRLTAARGTHHGRVLELQAQLDAERRIVAERERVFSEARQQLEASFSLLSSDALKRNCETFMALAEERFKRHQVQAEGSLGERQKSIEALVKPIAEALHNTERQIKGMEQERRESFGALERHLQLLTEDQKALQSATRNLVQALRRPEVRGRWGEMTLKRLVELAGMVEHCDFTEQTHVTTQAGAMRPDMVIRLPDEREIVIDVKTPLDAYLTAQEATDDASRKRALVLHARNVRVRVQQLADKAYWEQFAGSLDFVVLFIPGEQFLSAALDQDAELLEDALRRKVILATPTSLIALLRAVAFSWRQVAVIRNAEEIRSLAEEFYKRVGVFSEHFSRVGKALANGVDNYNRTVGSLERNILPSARRLTELGVSQRREIVSPEPIDKHVRETSLD